MMHKQTIGRCVSAACLLLLLMRCSPARKTIVPTKDLSDTMQVNTHQKGSFAYDLDFVGAHQKVVVLKDATAKSQVVVCPDCQGRVLTSTATGIAGRSFGYLNYERIASTQLTPQMQSYGGEDRFWIGPQGGQYAVFFKKGDPFDFAHWETPAGLDKEPFDVVSQTDSSISFTKNTQLKNYVETSFDVTIKRTISLINEVTAANLLKADIGGLDFVAFESDNELVNSGSRSWHKTKGLLSIWILGMFPGTPSSTVAIPYRQSRPDEEVVSQYFTDLLGTLPANRLKKDNGMVYYRADGNYCSKIGVKAKNALPVFGSFDGDHNVLTIVQYSLPETEQMYVNSSFSFQTEPYAGDAVNVYNQGSLDHKPVAPTFYELETSSPTSELAPGQSIRHVHRTFHFSGDRQKLAVLAKSVLGVDLSQLADTWK